MKTLLKLETEPNSILHALPTRYLITIPNINKINSLFSDNHNKHNICEKINYDNYSNLAQSQMLFYMHQQHMVPDLLYQR